MPDCLRCGRPVAVARRPCLYCGGEASAGDKAPIRPEAALTGAAIPAAMLPASPGPERVLVVLALDGVDPERLPGALGISRYEARQWARRGGYRLRRAAAPADAAADRESLAAQGITAFSIEEAPVREAANPETAQGGHFDGQTLRVRAPAGALELTPEDLLLVVKGPITREPPPMESRRWARTATLEPGFRFHLHRRDRARPLEIDPASFDLGAHRAAESTLLEIAGWIAVLAAGVPVDDAFRNVTPALAPAAPPPGAARLEDALRTSTKRAGPALDNLAQFRFYSAWRGAVERQARPR